MILALISRRIQSSQWYSSGMTDAATRNDNEEEEEEIERGEANQNASCLNAGGWQFMGGLVVFVSATPS